MKISIQIPNKARVSRETVGVQQTGRGNEMNIE